MDIVFLLNFREYLLFCVIMCCECSRCPANIVSGEQWWSDGVETERGEGDKGEGEDDDVC